MTGYLVIMYALLINIILSRLFSLPLASLSSDICALFVLRAGGQVFTRLSSSRARKTSASVAHSRRQAIMRQRALLIPRSGDISHDTHRLTSLRLTTKSAARYKSLWVRFLAFIHPRTTQDEGFEFDTALATFVTHLGQTGLSANTISSYTSAVSAQARLQGLSPSKPVRAFAALAAVRRLQGSGAFEPKSLAVDGKIIKELESLPATSSSARSRLIIAVVRIGVSMFARLSELFPPAPYPPLRPSDFSAVRSSQQARVYAVRLPHSKTDPHGVPTSRRVIANPAAVQDLEALITCTPPGRPIFGTLSVSEFRTRVRSWLKRIRPTFSGRFSLRAGKVSSLLAAGVDSDTIMLAGGWRSTAMRSYLRFNPSSLADKLTA